MIAQHIEEVAPTMAPRTAYQKGVMLNRYMAWLAIQSPRRRHTVDDLSLTNLRRYHGHLVAEGLKPSSCTSYLDKLHQFWKWAAEHDDYGPLTPPPRRLKLAPVPAKLVRAPNWAQMDEAIAASSAEWHRRLLVLLRCTGLRCNHQAMALRWDWVDLEAQRLTIPSELGKSVQESRGRVVPLAPPLAAELASWGLRDGLVLQRKGKPLNYNNALLATKRAWVKAKAPEDVWRRRPHHAFRKGFETGLLAAGARFEVAEYLVGHSLPGMLDVYMDPALALALDAAVDLVPEIGASKVARLERKVEG
jgi:integrase